MDRRTIDKYLGLLAAERERLRRRIGFLGGGDGRGGLDQSMADSTRELSMYDNHPADIASELFEREKDLGLRDDARAALRMVDRAIERARLGTYGSCERCGRDIDEGRLQTIPYAALCSRCQREAERRATPRPERPAEEGFIGQPFGGHITDERSPGIDGDDVWRAVARYGTASSPQDTPGVDEREEGSMGEDSDSGAVEETDLIIAGDPDEIPPDPSPGRAHP